MNCATSCSRSQNERGGRTVGVGIAQDLAQNNEQTRASVAATAEKYNGSTDWGYSKQKGAFACNTNKCNAFVGDVTKEAGVASVS